MNRITALSLAVTAALLGGCSAFYTPADQFAVPLDQARQKLAAVSIDGEKREFYGTMGIEASVVTNRQVKWTSDNGTAHYECLLNLAPLADDASQTHVAVKCSGGGGGDGAAAGMTHNMFRNNLIDLVDATLRGQSLADSRSASSRWPDDGVDGSMGKAMGDAIEMDRQMHEMKSELEADGQRQSDSAEAPEAETDSSSRSESFE